MIQYKVHNSISNKLLTSFISEINIVKDDIVITEKVIDNINVLKEQKVLKREIVVTLSNSYVILYV